jgi:hypothetical protein
LDYIAFLDEKFSEFWEWELVDNKSILISKVLPTYSELVSDLWNGTLSELKFINYIESIMETFSLTFENQVWFSEIELLEWYSVWILDDSLETNVYYIPLTFDITWKRADILDFLYFAWHVGKIDINTDTNDLYIDANLDSDFRTTFRNKILKWQNNILSEGIFNNQILDVESLSFAEYIDPETNTSRVYEENSLANYIKTSTFSKDWDFKATIKLRFYVKWLPIYRIENYISGFISEFSKTFGQINNILWNWNLNSTDKQKLTDISTTMAQFQKSVLPNIQKSLATKNTINEWYNLVNNYYSTLNSYKTTLEQIVSNME